MAKQIYKSKENRVIAGVAGGIAEYFDIDPVIVRLIFVLFTVFPPYAGLILYIIAAIIMPDRKNANHKQAKIEDKIKSVADDFKESAQNVAEKVRENVKDERQKNQALLGLVLIVLGLLFLLNQFNPWISLSRVWPLLLVVLGIVIITPRRNR